MDTANRKTGFYGHILAALSVGVWGTTYISTKVLLRTFEPIEILFIRFVIGFIVLFIMSPHILKLKDLKEELYFLGAGVTGITAYYYLEHFALKFTLATNVGVIISVAPFFTGLILQLINRKNRVLSRNFIFGFIIAMTGVVFLNFNGNAEFAVNPFGDFLAVMAALCWSFYSLFSRKVMDMGYDVIRVTRRMFLYGIAFMLPIVAWQGFHVTAEEIFRPVNLLNLLFLGIVACSLCFIMWNYATGAIGPVKTSVYIYVTPVVTTVTAALILGEPVTWAAVVGIVLALSGLIISERNPAVMGRHSSSVEKR